MGHRKFRVESTYYLLIDNTLRGVLISTAWLDFDLNFQFMKVFSGLKNRIQNTEARLTELENELKKLITD